MEDQMMIPTESSDLIIPGESISDAVIETGIMNPRAMAQLAKAAKTYAMSTLVSPEYRGNQANCFIACEMAARMNLSPFFVMQNLYVVNGRPSWSGQAAIALINGCGLFRSGSVNFRMVGTPGENDWGCYVEAVRKTTGETVRGTTVRIQLAVDEGWMQKSGSKWKTMPEQMLKYRAASYFARVECPNILMGFQLAEEVEDVHGGGAAETEKTITIDRSEVK